MMPSVKKNHFLGSDGCFFSEWVIYKYSGFSFQSWELHREITSFLPLFQFQDIVLNINPSVSDGKLQTSLALDR